MAPHPCLSKKRDGLLAFHGAMEKRIKELKY